jgi:FixJ family two-component response regulator
MNRELTVYVVDDDPGVREGLGRLLRAAGLRVRLCADVEEVIAHRAPDGGCALVDLSAQRQEPRGLAERLRAAGQDIPVIALTGSEREDVAREAFAAGASLFFRKPVDGRALLDAIEWVTRHDHPRRNP